MRFALVLIATLALVGQAAAGGGRYPPQPKWSRLDRNGNYLPAFEDSQFRYYRFEVISTLVEFAAWDPHPEPGITLLESASSGTLKDAKTGRPVGVYGQTTSLLSEPQPGADANQLIFQVAEMGPTGVDTIILSGGVENNPSPPFGLTDHDVAITGGTGRFLGAQGHSVASAGDRAVFVIYVPKYRSF